MALTAIVTNAGRAALVNAANTGTAPVTIAQVGLTATAVVPGVGITALPGEYKRVATISGDVVADDTIHLIVRDESADVFTVRSFALYLADGTLLAIYGQAGVILEKSAQAMMLLAIDVQFADVAAAMLTFGDANFLNPPATTEMQGVVELATVGEAQTGIDALRALTPAAAKAAILGWLLAQDGSGSGLDADLLDGQDGSYYSNIPQRLGYTPANKAGDTFTGYTKIRYSNRYTGQAIQNDYGSGSQTASVFLDALNENGIVSGNMTFDMNADGSSAWNVSLTSAGSRTVDRRINALTVNSSAMFFMGSTIWHSGNDGAGSGLDADLLDGQDSSYYTNVPQRLGYTPANKAGDTFSSTMAIAKNGSQELHFSGTGNYKWRAIGLNAVGSGGGFALQYTTDNFVSSFVNGLTLTNGGSASTAVQGTLWGAANDGAGSGLDADLLDGQDSTAFAKVAGTFFQGNNTGIANNQDWTLFFLRNNQGSSSAIGNFSVECVNENNITTSSLQTLGNTDGSTTFAFASTPAGSRTADRRSVGAYLRGPGRVHDFYATAMYLNGNQLWHAGNDGAGSGLDADLLDGQDGSYYSNIPQRLGYTPANKAGDNFTGFVTVGYNAEYAGFAIKSTYGNSSRAAHAFLDYKNENDITLTNVTTDILADGSSALVIQTTASGSRTADRRQIAAVLRGPGRAHDFYASSMWLNGIRVWDGASDGAGSGLDADLLDGLDGSAYARSADFSFGSNANGYWEKTPNGIIEQWGTVTGTFGEGPVAQSFPIPFTDLASVNVQVTAINPAGSTSNDIWCQRGAKTLSSFQAVFQSQTSGNTGGGYEWRAKGR
ncbi:gp53-like domain-containing protein [Sphingobium chungangianum]